MTKLLYNRRLLARIGCSLALCILLAVYAFRQNQQSSPCRLYPDHGNVVYAVKTGATEPRNKFLPILRTSLQCATDVLFLSDIEDTQSEHPMHDVLRHFSPAAMVDNTDFDLYRRIHSLQASGEYEDLDELSKVILPLSNTHSSGKSPGWILDKYKFLHVIDAVYALRPNREWYFFLETDTYLSWSNFHRWLPTLDPSRPQFLGNSIQKDAARGAQYFGHGGSGILLSGDVVEKVAKGALASKWDLRANEWETGDFLFADFLFHELGLSVTNTWPAFDALNATSIDLRSAWCEPVITLHHMQEYGFDLLYEKERLNDFSRLSRSDVYSSAYPPDFPLRAEMADWDNLSEAHEYRLSLDPGADAHAGVENCRMACESIPDCFEYLFRNTTLRIPSFSTQHECILSNTFRLGHSKPAQTLQEAREPGVSRSWTSGWHVDRIRAWITEQGRCGNR